MICRCSFWCFCGNIKLSHVSRRPSSSLKYAVTRHDNAPPPPRRTVWPMRRNQASHVRRRQATHVRHRRAWAKHLYKARADRWHLSFYQRCHQTLPLKPPPHVAHVIRLNPGLQKFKYFWNSASALGTCCLEFFKPIDDTPVSISNVFKSRHLKLLTLEIWIIFWKIIQHLEFNFIESYSCLPSYL